MSSNENKPVETKPVTPTPTPPRIPGDRIELGQDFTDIIKKNKK